jgi:riboflavin synthase
VGVFTGIVREVGRLHALSGDENGVRLELAAPRTAGEVTIGDSVALSGVCLTVESVKGDRMVFHAVPETLRRTTLGRLGEGAEINVETAVRAGEPLGGHYVQGHVDAVGRIQSVEAEGEGLRVVVEAPPEVLRLCVEKGSIAVEGVALTVAELYDDAFAVALVPHTLEATTLSELAPGREVNLEADVLAKYVERLASPAGVPSRPAEPASGAS